MGIVRVGRFLDGHFRHPHPGVQRTAVQYGSSDRPHHAFLFSPVGSLPARPWIALHGLTVPGNSHPTLLRFASALARSSATVLVPDIPEWRDLRIDRAAGTRAITEAIRYFREVLSFDEPVRIMGGSFGATQALHTAGMPEAARDVEAVVSFGGYCSLQRTVRFMFTGEHDWEGESYRIEPDPYGRWIVTANYIGAVPDLPEAESLAAAARELARTAGTRFVYAGDPEFDDLKGELRSRLSPAAQEVWDLVAPPARVPPERDAAGELADRIYQAASHDDAGVEPAKLVAQARCKVVLAHGYEDKLIPFTEAYRLREALDQSREVDLRLTRLFSHSQAARPGVFDYPREILAYLDLLSKALD